MYNKFIRHELSSANCSSCISLLLFFFSSRRRHTRLQGDWSSDVCSSDLSAGSDMAVTYRIEPGERIVYLTTTGESSFAEWRDAMMAALSDPAYRRGFNFRSEERRVGKEGRSRWSPYH